MYLCVILHFYAEYHEYMHNFFRTSAPIDLTYSAPPLSHRYKNTIMFDPFNTHNFGRDDNLSFLRLSPASDAEIKACASENSPAAKDKKTPRIRGERIYRQCRHFSIAYVSRPSSLSLRHPQAENLFRQARTVCLRILSARLLSWTRAARRLPYCLFCLR